MSGVEELWERLVRAALRRERTGDDAYGRPAGGIAGNVPSALAKNRDIDEILRVADEIQDDDPTVSRILCEHAYSLSQNLDPNSEGRGVLQFKTGLMSVIKQKLAKREVGTIDRIEGIWCFQPESWRLYFNPATVKMLSNLKVLVIALLLKVVMKRRFSIIQWEALALLLIGISVNQLRSLPEGTTALGLPVTMGAYLYTFIFVTVPSMASVYNEYALKSQYDTSIYLQNLFLYGYGAMFNFLGIVVTAIFKGPSSFDILEGHSKATMLLIANNAAQGILSSFFFKYADTILKKYSSTVATIFTGIASAVLFGHKLTMNFLIGISIVFISMHQFFSPLSKVRDEQNGVMELHDVQDKQRSKDSFINMAAGANEEASHRVGHDERQPLLPT
ncbi:unnamed protein product [Trifolium pratense]|uniref:Uncharacterized protein n=1 Tax=Trifolium pratense TaxID=57577 RepID=A0ACB0IGS7_TRIPR|nr:unnamed protein product [Trifolium pratense]